MRWALPPHVFVVRLSPQAYHPLRPAARTRTGPWRQRWQRAFTGSTRSAPPPARRKPRPSPAVSTSGSPTRIWPAASAEQRAAAALALLAFARRRLPGVAKVRVFNPTAAEHGFESRHTDRADRQRRHAVPGRFDRQRARTAARSRVHLLAHPVLPVRRDLDGDLLRARRADGQAPLRIDDADRDRPPGRAGPARRSRRGAGRVLAEVRLAVGDWRAMRQAALDAVEDLAPGPHASRSRSSCAGSRPITSPSSAIAAIAMSRTPRSPAACATRSMPGSALGILRRDEVRLFEAGLGGGEAMARFARGPQTLLIVKTDRESLVHRRGAMDCVIVKTLRRRTAGSPASGASPASSPRPPITRRCSRCRCCAAGSSRCCARAGLDPQQP